MDYKVPPSLLDVQHQVNTGVSKVQGSPDLDPHQSLYKVFLPYTQSQTELSSS